MVLIYQVLTIECLKKVFLISNDFVPNGSSLLKTLPFGIGTDRKEGNVFRGVCRSFSSQEGAGQPIGYLL